MPVLRLRLFRTIGLWAYKIKNFIAGQQIIENTLVIAKRYHRQCILSAQVPHMVPQEWSYLAILQTNQHKEHQ